jgi:transcriptional regulator GlxA family with amidase domain
MNDWKKLQRALEFASRNPGRNVLLRDLAAETGQSLFRAHRALRAVLGETPKHFTGRLRVDRAAAALVSCRDSILDIALAFGFESHEAFCRAFRRRFGMSQSAYRKRGLIGLSAKKHARFVEEIAPCAGLYHIDSREGRSQNPMTYTIS